MSFLMQLQDVETAGRLAPFSAAFRAGEIVHLAGPNGAGKSTLLTRMAGLSDGPGTVHFNGRLLDEWPARELARRRGYLCQHQTPPFAMPVWHYLALHMQQQGDSARLSDIAARLGLDNKLGRPVNQLSGGEWQRVRLAAVILQIDPLSNSAGQLLLLDEPSLGLAPLVVKQIFQILRELTAQGMTLFLVEQNARHALNLSDRAYVMVNGQIRLSGSGQTLLNDPEVRKAYLGISG